jgi:N-acetylmuramoyl-L-alanine amidase
MPGQLVPEKQYALDMALRVDAILRRAGVRTVLTRRGDYFVPLGDRTALANRYRNGVFVSFHFNGAANFNASGIETYYASGRESAALASALHRAILGATGAADRRVRSRSFFVLRKTSIPAVLIEGGFLTNRTEARRISSSSYRARMAEAIARVLIARYR